jgi:hypothetical protein
VSLASGSNTPSISPATLGSGGPGGRFVGSVAVRRLDTHSAGEQVVEHVPFLGAQGAEQARKVGVRLLLDRPWTVTAATLFDEPAETMLLERMVAALPVPRRLKLFGELASARVNNAPPRGGRGDLGGARCGRAGPGPAGPPALVAGKSRAAFDTAVCLQETQGGTIAAGEHAMVILPFPLREPALAVRDQRDYSRLWPAVRAFYADVGLQAVANLAVFFRHFAQELDRFVAEFESLDGQVGAVVLADGGVLGVERTPSVAYWETLWAPLLRGCYGAEMIRRQQTGAPARPPATRVPLDTAEVGSLEALADAVDAADRAERRLTDDRIAELERLPLKADETGDRHVDVARLETIHGWRFVGQLLRRGGRVEYASLVTRGG